MIIQRNSWQPFNAVSPAILVSCLTLHLSLPALREAMNHSWKKIQLFLNLMWALLLIGFLYHEGPEGMPIKEIAKNGGLRFSFWTLEVLVLRVRKRPLSLSTVVFSSLSKLVLPKKKI